MSSEKITSRVRNRGRARLRVVGNEDAVKSAPKLPETQPEIPAPAEKPAARASVQTELPAASKEAAPATQAPPEFKPEPAAEAQQIQTAVAPAVEVQPEVPPVSPGSDGQSAAVVTGAKAKPKFKDVVLWIISAPGIMLRQSRHWLNECKQGNVTTPHWISVVAPRLAKWLEKPKRQLQPLFDWLIGSGHENFDDSKTMDFIAEADYAILKQEPVRARALLKVLLWIVLLFLVWASFAKVSEVTRGEGKVIPFSQVQIMQSLDGGIVSQILVHEGDVVNKGQVLLRMDDTRSESSLKESRAQFLSLEAKAARLRAIAENEKFIAPEDVLQEDPKTVEEERRLYESRKAELDTTLAISREQLAQRQHELAELKAKHEQAAKAWELTNRELTVTRPLVAAGAVSDVDILRLERDVSRFRGDRDMASAQIERVQAAIAESTSKVKEVENSFRNDARKELSDVLAKLNSLQEGSVALSDKVKRSVMTSPVKGTVKRLMVNTVGGVIQPGKDVMEIVPLEDNLLLEARIQPKDIAFLRPGLKATVKFNAYDFVVYGGLQGTLEQIGADTVLDEKGNAYYVVRVRTDKSSLGKNLPIMPGMVAEVDILTGEKSVLSYLLKPVLRAKARALTER